MRNEKGFTILELMVVVGISAIMSYALFLALRSGNVQKETTDVKMAIQDSAREGVYKMLQEIRQSAPNRVVIGSGGTTGSTIQFNIPNPNSPVGADYKVDWTTSQVIQYARGGTNNAQLIRTNVSTGQTKVIANDVTAITFTGNSASPNLVTIAISVQRTLMNGRTVPATPFQMTAQGEVRNT